MNLKQTKAATVTATLIIFGSLVGLLNGAVMVTNWNKTATTLSFDLSGSITDNNPGPRQQFRLFLGLPGVSIGGDVVTADVEGVSVEHGGSTLPAVFPIIYNGFGGSGNDVLQISSGGSSTFFGPDFRLGDTFNYSISFTGLMNGTGIVDQPTISWGRDSYFDAPEPAFNVGGVAVPESSSAILLALGALGVIARRKRTI